MTITDDDSRTLAERKALPLARDDDDDFACVEYGSDADCERHMGNLPTWGQKETRIGQRPTWLRSFPKNRELARIVSYANVLMRVLDDREDPDMPTVVKRIRKAPRGLTWFVKR